jgi:eukaryotic-like serine/threonine-protein kinase
MPNGRSVIFSAQIGGGDSVWRQSADGTGNPERLIPMSHSGRTSAVSKDGTRVLLSQAAADTGVDVVMLTLENPPRIHPLLQTPFVERNAELSPDEHWLAYESNESGQFQISVRPFPDVTQGRYQVSAAGGTQPHWARGGGELFYVAPDGALMSVRTSEGTAWKASAPTKVVTRQYFHGGGANFSRTYDVSPDGKRFLMLKDKPSDQAPAPAKVVVVRNWFGELKRLVPAGL